MQRSTIYTTAGHAITVNASGRIQSCEHREHSACVDCTMEYAADAGMGKRSPSRQERREREQAAAATFRPAKSSTKPRSQGTVYVDSRGDARIRRPRRRDCDCVAMGQPNAVCDCR